jgi:hypothetical protein
MKKVKLLIAGIIAACTLQAQNVMNYKGLTVDFEQLTENLNGTGQILDTAQKYEGVAGAKLDFINFIDGLNPDLSTDNFVQAKRMLSVTNESIEKEMLARLSYQYTVDSGIWNSAGFIGEKIKAKTVSGNWKTGIYQGEVNGKHVIQVEGRPELAWIINIKTLIVE